MTNSKILHIITFDVPFPANYGGAIDVFFKIKELKKQGVNIILHAFTYANRVQQQELEKYCKKIFYYKRNRSILNALKSLPYIVASRANKDLLDNVLKYPGDVWMEGTHSTFYLSEFKKHGCKTFVRMHNIESTYYNYLAEIEPNILKKIYFITEAKKLKKYEAKLNNSDNLIFISPIDKLKWEENYPEHKTKNYIIFPFHGAIKNNREIQHKQILFHANFDISENIIAAKKIIDLLPSLKIPVVFAGKNAARFKSTEKLIIINNPTEDEMQKTLLQSEIHLLPTPQPTGIKLKIIYSLFTRKYILCIKQLVENMPWQNDVQVFENFDEIPILSSNQIERNMDRNYLNTILNNEKNAQEIIKLLN
jgi:hypothetical protein